MLNLANVSSTVAEKQIIADAGPLGYFRKNLPNGGASHIFPAGVEIFQQDEVASEVLLLESGLIKLTRSEHNGREFIVSLRFAGSLLGSSSVVSAQRHPFSAITVTPCRLLQIPKKHFIDLLHTDQQIGSFVQGKLGQELFELTINMSQLACIPARQRLEQLLLRLSRNELSNDQVGSRFRLHLKYWEVAELLGVTPAYLTRLFVELETAGLLSRHKGWIKLPAPENLWHEPALGFDYY